MAASVLAFNGKSWQPGMIDLRTTKALHQVSYIFLEKRSFLDDTNIYKRCSDDDRRHMLAPFKVPDLIRSQLCTALNGYFGCQSSLKHTPGASDQLSTLSTWTQILTKKILNNSDQTVAGGKDYRWHEMAFFTRWTDTGVNQILCIDTPPTLREELTKVLAASPTLELQDPFAMFRPLLDEVLKLCDENTWRVAKEVRRIEKRRSERPDFEQLCDLDRHARHLVEVEAVAIETMERLMARQEMNFKILPRTLTKTYQSQAKEHLEFQLQIMKNLKWRAQASSERLDGEINLAYNMLANIDNQIMRSITLLTMIFLPATFVSALFSTTFFSFGKDGLKFSRQFWIYWVAVIPLTIIVVASWWFWLGGSYKAMRSKLLHDSHR